MIQGGKDTVHVELLVLIYSNLAKLWKEQRVLEGSGEHDRERSWNSSEWSRTMSKPWKNSEEQRGISWNRMEEKEKEYHSL
jgi:hypothetical protein